MEISKKLRNEAIELCAVYASWWASDVADGTKSPRRHYPADARRLVRGAVKSVSPNVEYPFGFYDRLAIDYAEAEAMLREGWTP